MKDGMGIIVALLVSIIQMTWEQFKLDREREKALKTDYTGRKLEDVSQQELLTLIEFIVRFVLKVFNVPFAQDTRRGGVADGDSDRGPEVSQLVASAMAQYLSRTSQQ